MQVKKINLNTINWRLPFSYAVIALITALSLGSIMLLVLNSYYTNFEKDYLKTNAEYLQPVIGSFLAANMEPAQLREQLSGLAFLSQVQIRILDKDNAVVADSGTTEKIQEIIIESKPKAGFFISMENNASSSISGVSKFVVAESVEIIDPSMDLSQQVKHTVVTISSAPLGGYWLSGETYTGQNEQSAQTLLLPIADSSYQMELSNGPAYGSDILHSVATAWGFAVLFSCIVAIVSGFVISRQVTRPVLHLTNATQKMEQGQLSTRVDLPAGKMDEFQQLSNSFNNMANRIEKTISTLRSFVSDAAHELNTPLTALKTNLELAQNEDSIDRIKHYLAAAYQNSQRLEQLSASLLDLSRIESNNKPSDFSPLNLSQLMRNISEPFASRAEQKELTFSLDISDQELSILANERQITQALSNLLENALKFTPSGGAIQLSLASQEEIAVIKIEDTGIGIPPEDIPHLFERFHRGRNSTAYPGNGLGLAIVKAIVDAHQGKVEVLATPSGSCFRIELHLIQKTQ